MRSCARMARQPTTIQKMAEAMAAMAAKTARNWMLPDDVFM